MAEKDGAGRSGEIIILRGKVHKRTGNVQRCRPRSTISQVDGRDESEDQDGEDEDQDGEDSVTRMISIMECIKSLVISGVT